MSCKMLLCVMSVQNLVKFGYVRILWIFFSKFRCLRNIWNKHRSEPIFSLLPRAPWISEHLEILHGHHTLENLGRQRMSFKKSCYFLFYCSSGTNEPGHSFELSHSYIFQCFVQIAKLVRIDTLLVLLGGISEVLASPWSPREPCSLSFYSSINLVFLSMALLLH